MPIRPGLLFACAFVVSLVLGCKCGSDKPYTPFGMASADPSVTPPPAPLAASAEVPDAGFVPKKAELAPGGVQRWNLGGTSIDAPSDRRFEQGVSADFDGDGTNEIVAWLLASESATPSKPIAAGELWLFAEGAPPRALFPLPGFVPTGPGCRLLTKLAQTGPRSVTLDVRAVCEARMIARAPVAALAILAPLAEEPVIYQLRYAAEAPGEKVELSVTSDDRDADGKDDATVHVSLATTGKPATVELAWFERAAGASREKAEPARSLARLAAREAARAKQKKTAGDVIERVALLRRLAAFVCSEGGTPRLFDRDGASLRCETLEAFGDSLAAAEVDAELARGSALEAFAAHSRDGWYFRGASAKQRTALEKVLLAAVTRRPLSVSTQNAIAELAARPRYSPLSFDTDGKLLIQTRGGVLRMGEGGNAEASDPEAPPPSWPLDVSDASSARVTGVSFSCDRNEVQLSVQGGPELGTRLLAPRPGTCASGRFQAFPEPAPIAFAGGEFEFLVGGSLLGNATARGVLHGRGTPRSSDGRWLVTPTRLGVLVSGGEKPELWELPAEAPKPTELSDCVVANERRAAACLAGSRPLLLTPQ